jgi:hypothetical protein
MIINTMRLGNILIIEVLSRRRDDGVMASAYSLDENIGPTRIGFWREALDSDRLKLARNGIGVKTC